MRHRVKTILAVLFLTAISYGGEMIVSNVILDYLGGDRKPKDIKVSNLINESKYKDRELTEDEIKKETLYVETKIIEVQNPGLPNENRVDITADENRGLVISASKFELAPKTSKTVRFIIMEKGTDVKKDGEENAKKTKTEPASVKKDDANDAPPAQDTDKKNAGDKSEDSKKPEVKDKIYRVQFIPKIGKIKSKVTAIKILIGYEVLVIVRPPARRQEIAANWGKKTLAFENKGNSNILLSGGKQCDEKGENCKDLPAARLYPDMKWTLQLPYKTAFDYSYNTGTRLYTKKFDPKSKNEIIKHNENDK